VAGLAQPLALPCGAVLANRLAKSAMSEALGDAKLDSTPALARLYATWAAGGAGLLITGNVMVQREHLGETGNVVFDERTDLAASRAWATAATQHGTSCWVQLNHPGRQVPRGLGDQPVAPSAIAVDIGISIFASPRALSGPETEAIIASFGYAAGHAKAAGFTGVQLHAAHGYLVSQFLSPRTNQRDDEWGGTPEKRRRFLLAVVARIRAAVGPDFPVGVKLNSADFQRGGFDEAESLTVVEALAAAGVDLLEISGGTYEAPVMMGPIPQKASTAAREAFFMDYARKVRQRVALPLMLTGGFRTRAGMDAALAEGAIDVVGIARPLAVEPDLPRRLLDGSALGAIATPSLKLGGAFTGFLDLAWHSQQLARMGQGRAPQLRSSPWAALVTGLIGHGVAALFPKRGK
jgi:2,4-dienoyl-CoA reductase-like NADH-dependent reductase (Old Yellow Enzyme family)